MEELQSAVRIVVELPEVLSGELRALILRSAAELLLVLPAPLVVQLRRIAARLLANSHAPHPPAAASLSQAPATVEPMLLSRPHSQTEPEVRSA